MFTRIALVAVLVVCFALPTPARAAMIIKVGGVPIMDNGPGDNDPTVGEIKFDLCIPDRFCASGTVYRRLVHYGRIGSYSELTITDALIHRNGGNPNVPIIDSITMDSDVFFHFGAPVFTRLRFEGSFVKVTPAGDIIPPGSPDYTPFSKDTFAELTGSIDHGPSLGHLVAIPPFWTGIGPPPNPHFFGDYYQLIQSDASSIQLGLYFTLGNGDGLLLPNSGCGFVFAPEPGSLTLVGIGAAGVAARRLRRGRPA